MDKLNHAYGSLDIHTHTNMLTRAFMGARPRSQIYLFQLYLGCLLTWIRKPKNAQSKNPTESDLPQLTGCVNKLLK